VPFSMADQCPRITAATRSGLAWSTVRLET
jgi:hypothetical protein